MMLRQYAATELTGCYWLRHITTGDVMLANRSRPRRRPCSAAAENADAGVYTRYMRMTAGALPRFERYAHYVTVVIVTTLLGRHYIMVMALLLSNTSAIVSGNIRHVCRFTNKASEAANMLHITAGERWSVLRPHCLLWRGENDGMVTPDVKSDIR